MFKILTTKLRPFEDNNLTRVIVLGRPTCNEGDLVDLRFNALELGEFRVSSKVVTTIAELTQKQLNSLHNSYRRMGLLCNKLANAYGTQIQGMDEITIVTLLEPRFDVVLPEEILEGQVPTRYTVEEFFHIGEEKIRKRQVKEES